MATRWIRQLGLASFTWMIRQLDTAEPSASSTSLSLESFSMALLDADAIHPITLPDGKVYFDTVYLKNVIDHPRMEVGDFSYYTHSGRPEETAQILAPYLGHGVRERLVIGKFVQIARGSYFITSSANHR